MPSRPGWTGDDAAPHAALRRKSGAIEPFARKVVHAAGRHHRQDVVDERLGDRACPGHRVDAAVGERRADQGQVAAGDADRALPEIRLERRRRLFGEDRIVAQQPADRPVAMARFAFGSVDALVDVEIAPGVARKRRENPLDLLVGAVAPHEAACGDCTGIDQRIHRSPGLGRQADRVERLAGGLDADLREHAVLGVVLECEAVGERLRHRLDREGLPRVAHLVDVAIAGGDADAEPLRIGPRELGDVVGDRAVAQFTEAVVEGGEVILDG